MIKMCKTCVNYDECQHNERLLEDCIPYDGYCYEKAEEEEDFTDHLLNMGATKGYFQGVEDFVNWFIANDFDYDMEINKFHRTRFDGHIFAEECYSRNELIKVFKEECR